MIYHASIIRQILSSSNVAVAGNAASNLVSSAWPGRRSGVLIANKDASANLYVLSQQSGVAAPGTVTATSASLVVPPLATISMPFDSSIALFGESDSGGAGTIHITTQEFNV